MKSGNRNEENEVVNVINLTKEEDKHGLLGMSKVELSAIKCTLIMMAKNKTNIIFSPKENLACWCD